MDLTGLSCSGPWRTSGLRIVEMLAVLGHQALCPGVFKRFGAVGVGGQVVRESRGIPFGHAEVVHEVVTAVLRRRAGDALGLLHRAERPQDQVEDLARGTAALEDEIEARQASHGAPVDDLVLPVGVVAQVCGHDVLQGVHGRHVDGGLLVRVGQANVVGGEGAVSDGVHPAGEYAGDDGRMVDGKAGYQVHGLISFRGNGQHCLSGLRSILG